MPTSRKVTLLNKKIETKDKISLKELLNPISAQSVGSQEKHQSEPFTDDEMYDKWMMFARSVKLKDLDLYSTLTMDKPTLKENYIIELKIFNNAQEADVNNHKQELLKYLRTQLKNTAISLEMVIDTQAEQKGVYTPQDKYKKLVEKNPSIDNLRKRFNLGF